MTQDITPGKPIRTYAADGSWRDWSTDELVAQRKNYLQGWMCGAGVDSLFIDMDGFVYTASCRVGGRLGSVWDNFKVPEKWIECSRNVCSCGADLFIPKMNVITIQKSPPLIDPFDHILRKTAGLDTELDKRDDAQQDFVAMERTHASNRKQVYWEISRRCNYDCSYCWPWIHNNTDPHKSLEQLMNATFLIEREFLKGAPANFIISGGEPTANPAFLDWLRYLNAAGHHVSLHSNGSRRPEYYREVIKYGDLNLSVHFEFYNKEKFLKVVEEVTKEKVFSSGHVGHLEVKIMMAPHNAEEARLLEADLKAIPNFSDFCTWAFVPIRGTLQNKNAQPNDSAGSEVMIGYTKEDLKLFGAGKIDE
jgi:organic radical activating enzyme